jgi:hypothetical protein
VPEVEGRLWQEGDREGPGPDEEVLPGGHFYKYPLLARTLRWKFVSCLEFR